MTVVDDEFSETVLEEPVTWEAAADIAISEIFEFNLAPGSHTLELMRAQLDFMISRNIAHIAAGESGNSSFWMTSEEMYDFWKILGWSAADAANSHGISFFSLEADWVADAGAREKIKNLMSSLVCGKQRDYGSDNILRFGRIGLLVRAHDKIARLENLAARAAAPTNESIADNYIDVIGYCTVAMLLERGWFTLPLGEK